MADDKSIQDGRDRSMVAADPPYALAYFAKKHGLTNDEARKILQVSALTGESRSNG